MSKNLVISMGNLNKRAQGLPGEGPSFEQQFGILANAQITDKYPSLGPCKIAFQMQEKNDENTFAVGASVYKLGKSIIYIPAVFRNGRIWTGVIMFVPEMDRFLPISDAWLSYIKNRDISEVGDIVPALYSTDMAESPASARVKDSTDPFTKTSSYRLATVFDTALKMGKQASLALLDKLSDVDYLNNALKFYTPLDLDRFAKKASLSFVEYKPLIITLFDKRAGLLNSQLKLELYRDGFIIKNAAENKISSDSASLLLKVIRILNPSHLFITPRLSCICDLLLQDGTLDQNVSIYKAVSNDFIMPGNDLRLLRILDHRHKFGNFYDVDSFLYLKHQGGSDNNAITMIAVNKDGWSSIDRTVVALASSIRPIKLNTFGHSISNLNRIPYKSALITPQGLAYILYDSFLASAQPNTFNSYNRTIAFALLYGQILPICTSTSMLFPKGTKVVFDDETKYTDDGKYKPGDEYGKPNSNSQIHYAKLTDLSRIINKYVMNTYDKLKVYSDGQLVLVSGEKIPDQGRTQVKLAALALVANYGISQANAKQMIRLTMQKAAAQHSPFADYFYIVKKAKVDKLPVKLTKLRVKGFPLNFDFLEYNNCLNDLERKKCFKKYKITVTRMTKTLAIPGDAQDWQLSNIGMSEVPQQPSNVTKTDLNGYAGQNDLQLMKDITTAVDAGIKEVFDMQTLKLLALSADPTEEVKKAIPDFMNCLDKLGRLTFLYHVHVLDMLKLYGAVKMDALSRALENTMKDLALLTAFIKLRGLSNDTSQNPDSGLLQTGAFL